MYINTSAKNVFKGISQPDQLNNWWTKKCTGTPKMGEVYNFYFSEEYNWFGEVTACIPAKSLEITITQADLDWNGTVLDYKLAEEKGKVLLSFMHRMWKTDNKHFRISSFCWAMLLNGLKNYLEKGVIVPFKNRA
ncbi:SRPBCC domain-containing protein [Galbibacter sp. PAP.153]|uniref:SRPBCC family protein n=1 Tax=Galbibacter sp. PAP.153 TaxID=3104623 RepID=UPI00300834F9